MIGLDILFEDNHCLAVNKPAGLLVQGDRTGDACLVDLVAADLKERFQKPGNVYVGLLHRLDRPVSGVVLVARTSKAASRLSRQFRDRTVGKRYWGIVEGVVGPDEGQWTDWLAKDEALNQVRLVAPGQPGASEAVLGYTVLERGRSRSLLEIRPQTGRGHQIRVQLASRGHPILGDGRYGARCVVRAQDGKRRIALHAYELSFEHPTRREVLSVRASVPSDWPGAAIGS